MSIRGLIIDDMTTTLQGITVVGGYNETVQQVLDDKILMPNQIVEFPVLLIVDSNESKMAGDVNQLLCSLEIIVTGYVKRVSDETDINDLRRKLQNDVEKILMLDETRGGYCWKTQCTRIITDNGINNEYGIFDMYFTCEYAQNRKNPSEVG